MSDIKRQLQQLHGSGDPSGGNGTSSIQEKLNRLYNRSGESGGTAEKYFPEENVRRAYKRLEELVPGEYMNTPAGDIYRARTTYDADYIHGNCSIDEYFDIDIRRLFELGKLKDTEVPEHSGGLFLDTEASGLSGGTGTYAFMIGLGYFHENEFVVDQLFVDSYATEEGMLDLLREYVKASAFLVTFNGKSFDINLLNTRYAMHGQASPFDDMPHLDLLHPSRNLWDLTLENCKLQTLEREILEFARAHDTPGEEVPGIYFDFIRTGDPSEIAGVFEHNVHDIVSLVSVTIMLEQNFREIRSIPTENGLTMFSRARIYERRHDYENAIECYTKALEQDLTKSRRFTALGNIAALHKRGENWERAIYLWEEQIEVMPTFALEPYVELAKYYEHQEKNFVAAMEYVNTVIEQLPGHREDELAALEHRLNRLRRKLERDA
ncbi:MAG: ribonuclease H-like domain-containing protein [Candidatus Marinimicrobia bacterium]|nr:ribonuclease H-like domain-containing protein [Candidatus Neomarinimicrobiota bacterium]MCF7828821.1 ribonuclease H-like domain-containing protein [Candidatus Neomarinimicrobiota bacterium]MCF7880738.1 ribonuclease H-like domain-containing protein [Candidatus Neomarinimicrobiota bacterium]